MHLGFVEVGFFFTTATTAKADAMCREAEAKAESCALMLKMSSVQKPMVSNEKTWLFRVYRGLSTHLCGEYNKPL